MASTLTPLNIALIVVCLLLAVLIVYLISAVKNLTKSLSSADALINDLQNITQDNKEKIDSILSNVDGISGDINNISNKISGTVNGIGSALNSPKATAVTEVASNTMKAKKAYDIAKDVILAGSVLKNFLDKKRERKLEKREKKLLKQLKKQNKKQK